MLCGRCQLLELYRVLCQVDFYYCLVSFAVSSLVTSSAISCVARYVKVLVCMLLIGLLWSWIRARKKREWQVHDGSLNKRGFCSWSDEKTGRKRAHHALIAPLAISHRIPLRLIASCLIAPCLCSASAHTTPKKVASFMTTSSCRLCYLMIW